MGPTSPAPAAHVSGRPARALNKQHVLVPAARPPRSELRGGIILKGLDEVPEVVGGPLLLVVSPATIDRVVTGLTSMSCPKTLMTSWPPTCCGPPTV
jgi:hypothetical protein